MRWKEVLLHFLMISFVPAPAYNAKDALRHTAASVMLGRRARLHRHLSPLMASTKTSNQPAPASFRLAQFLLSDIIWAMHQPTIMACVCFMSAFPYPWPRHDYCQLYGPHFCAVIYRKSFRCVNCVQDFVAFIDFDSVVETPSHCN